ncbi:arylformamidase [Priestia taiwanensis]|uniref:Kynurenine formamidase n=1 Tax=Priestia taiwanensis TaxID=1347902 RepID=A0A917AMV2_9BACI|nr:arylformamidase [Priestia taiwanensis]MBM7362458.1 arylformamidase [Priestia taiwanensis]GGE62364.1 kynurenine formamidase [Priestia taiwanensis]
MKKWIDISQALTNDIAVWPGDTPFSYVVNWPMEQSGSVNVGKITMSTHTGTHVDAPFHFDNNGKKVLDLDINVYIGKARVIDVSMFEQVGIKELENYQLGGVSRLLLKLSPNASDSEFPRYIPYIEEAAASYLCAKGVQLIGVDVPSVDPVESKELVAHHALFAHGIHILENLVLHHVKEGEYELIALPLALQDADGSPVRAVLREIEGEKSDDR